MNNTLSPTVITGLGGISGLGFTTQEIWSNSLEGKSGVRQIKEHIHIDPESLSMFPVEIAGFAPEFKIADEILAPKEQGRFDLFIHYALHAAEEALKHAQLDNTTYDPYRIGCIIGVGMGGFPFIEQTHTKFLESGKPRTSPFFIPSLIPNMASGLLSIKKGFCGTNLSISSACASSGHAIEMGHRMLQANMLDAVIVGGAEAVTTPLTTSGFASMKALSKRDVSPQKASCPFDKNRDGFVIGEGAGILVLERKDSAEKRGIQPIVEIAAAASSADAHHITAPHPEGLGAINCMKMAISQAEISPEKINYINAHGTSTPIGDRVENNAIKTVFGSHAHQLKVSSTKSMTGHLLGAASGIESLFCAMSCKEQTVPPTINLNEPDEGFDLDYTPHKGQPWEVNYALNNSFGFGGTNSCIIFKHIR